MNSEKIFKISKESISPDEFTRYKINEIIDRVNEITEILNDSQHVFIGVKAIDKVVDTAGAERILEQLEEMTR